MVPDQIRQVIDLAGEAVRALDDDAFELLLSNFQRLWPLRNEVEARSTIADLAQQTGISPSEQVKSVAWVIAVARHANQGGAEVDLRELESIKSSEKLTNRAAKTFQIARENGPRYEKTAARFAAAQGVQPAFEELIGTVELRGVLAAGTDLDQISSDAPYVALEPMASLSLKLDSGFPSACSFQISKPDLEKLIASLSRLKQRMEELELLVEIKK